MYVRSMEMENDCRDYVNGEEASSPIEELDDHHIIYREQAPSPKIGQTFQDIDELFQFYQSYAKDQGFYVVKASAQKAKGGSEQAYQTIRCHRFGKASVGSRNPLKPQASQRNGCQARVCASTDKNGRWRINSIFLDHNHDMTPSKSRFYRGHRNIPTHIRKRIEVNDIAGIPPSRTARAEAVEAGGHENLTFMRNDITSYVNRSRKSRLGAGDAQAMLNLFIEQQKSSRDFFYAFEEDDEGRLCNVFWADGRCRAAYREFGDVITFDSTYLMNKWEMPFAAFVGVNHHGHSTLFGCALIGSEVVDSYIWLFKTWLTCMDNVPPPAIITDQCPSIGLAIQIVFPGTRQMQYICHVPAVYLQIDCGTVILII